MNKVRRTIGVAILSLATMLAGSGTALAHVVVQPSEVKTAARVNFAVSVPNEHDTPVVGVRVVIPEGLESVRPFVKTGWNIEVTRTGEGEEATVSEIKWTNTGAGVPVDLKDEFLFGAKAPATATELKWKAYETYADGTVVAWEQEPSGGEENKPYSVTKVVSETAAEAGLKQAEQAAADASKAADRALYVAIVAIAVGAFGLVLMLRAPKKTEE